MTAAIHEWRRGGYLVSTDKALLDLDMIHGYLTHVYWAAGIARESVSRAIEHSLCFGLYGDEGQIGFARLLSDTVRFAYLMDVFVLESHQGQGLGRWLLRCVLDHPDVRTVRRVLLTTRDAHELYRKFGFEEVARPGDWMNRVREQLSAGSVSDLVKGAAWPQKDRNAINYS